MNLSLKEFKVDENLAYKITKFESCCDELKSCYFIDIETENDYSPRIGICQTVEYYDGEDTQTSVEYTPIQFCPFCGESIKVEIIDMEDLSVYYNAIEMSLSRARKNARETNSKKKEKEYLAIARELSDELEFYLSNDSIHMFIE